MSLTSLIVKIAAPLPDIESFDRYLFIGPHPDDIETGAGATAAKLAAAGKTVCFLICTDGRYGDGGTELRGEKLAQCRERECIASAKRLGVTDVFEAGTADFSPVSGSELFLSKIQHSARVAIDEQGVVAAAFTIEMLSGAGMPLDEIDFTLDRPFIFAITGETGDLLFIGIVNSAV